MSSDATYQPGVCNIGGSEQRRRYRYAAIAFAVAFGYVVAILAAETTPILLLGVAVPVALGTEMALQAHRSFCARLALSGRYSFDGDVGRVTDAEARRTDRRSGIRFVLVGLAVGVAAAAVAYGLAISI